jgi:hypothetical protein
MSKSRSGANNFYFGKKLHPNTISAARLVKGQSVYIYSEKDKQFIASYISMRETAKNLSINPGTLKKKLNSNIPFKGYYYYSYPIVK